MSSLANCYNFWSTTNYRVVWMWLSKSESLQYIFYLTVKPFRKDYYRIGRIKCAFVSSNGIILRCAGSCYFWQEDAPSQPLLLLSNCLGEMMDWKGRDWVQIWFRCYEKHILYGKEIRDLHIYYEQMICTRISKKAIMFVKC